MTNKSIIYTFVNKMFIKIFLFTFQRNLTTKLSNWLFHFCLKKIITANALIEIKNFSNKNKQNKNTTTWVKQEYNRRFGFRWSPRGLEMMANNIWRRKNSNANSHNEINEMPFFWYYFSYKKKSGIYIAYFQLQLSQSEKKLE